MNVGVLKILCLAISMHALTLPQDFPQLIFQWSLQALLKLPKMRWL